MIDVLFPEGRLVSGHPMIVFTPTDKHGKPKTKQDGVTPATQWSIGVAIPKNGQDWKATQWGQQIVQAAQDPVEGYSLAETNSPYFSWKVTDGDSTIPNKKGNVPVEQEGYKGHWVVFMSTQLSAPKCYHKDKYDPMQQIQNKDEIKKGDYVRVYCNVKGNKPSDTPGVYINPSMVSLERVGEPIASGYSGPAAADVFGGGALASVPAAPVMPNAPVTPPPPATDLLAVPPAPPVEEKYNVNGTVYTKSQLLSFPGWTEANLVGLPRA